MRATLSIILLLMIVFSTNIQSKVFEQNTSQFHSKQTSNRALQKQAPLSSFYFKEENLTLKIKFIGFNEQLINSTDIQRIMLKSYMPQIDIPKAKINFKYEFSYIDYSKEMDLYNYIKTNAINGSFVGYLVNQTLANDVVGNPEFYYQKYYETREMPKLFVPADGMKIDTKLVEKYINHNLFEESPLPSYTIFLINFSSFDTPNHSLEHWYTIEGEDVDSHKISNYMGFYNLSHLATAAWGGNHRFWYVDLSSRSYYLEYLYYLETIFGYSNNGDFLYYKYPDLDNFTQSFNLTTLEGKAALQSYILDWLRGFQMQLVLCKYVDPTPPLGETIALPILIFNNLTNNGYPIESLQWCITESWLNEQLSICYPWIKWNLTVEWVNLNEYPEIWNIFKDTTIKIQFGIKCTDIMKGLYEYLGNNLENYFDMDDANNVLPTYLFLMDNITLSFYNNTFTGVSIPGWQIIGYNQYRLFVKGEKTNPKIGVSSTILHEIGHSLGLPHPHDRYNGWSCALVADLMSYFSVNINCSFSTFYIDGLGRMHADANYLYGLQELSLLLTFYSDSKILEQSKDTVEEINATFAESLIYYHQMDYNASIYLSREARKMIVDLEYTITHTEEVKLHPLLILVALTISSVLVIQRKKKLNH